MDTFKAAAFDFLDYSILGERAAGFALDVYKVPFFLCGRPGRFFIKYRAQLGVEFNLNPPSLFRFPDVIFLGYGLVPDQLTELGLVQRPALVPVDI